MGWEPFIIAAIYGLVVIIWFFADIVAIDQHIEAAYAQSGHRMSRGGIIPALIIRSLLWPVYLIAIVLGKR